MLFSINNSDFVERTKEGLKKDLNLLLAQFDEIYSIAIQVVTKDDNLIQEAKDKCKTVVLDSAEAQNFLKRIQSGFSADLDSKD